MYDELYNKIDALFQTVAHGYDGHQGDVLALIHECRRRLQTHLGSLGPWETEELDYAVAAVQRNWLRLALVSAEKALVVTQLPGEEYEAGYNYGRKSN